MCCVDLEHIMIGTSWIVGYELDMIHVIVNPEFQ